MVRDWCTEKGRRLEFAGVRFLDSAGVQGQLDDRRYPWVFEVSESSGGHVDVELHATNLSGGVDEGSWAVSTQGSEKDNTV